MGMGEGEGDGAKDYMLSASQVPYRRSISGFVLSAVCLAKRGTMAVLLPGQFLVAILDAGI